MTVWEFMQKYDNKFVDNKQCVGLINQFRAEVIGTPAFGVAAAKDIYNAAGSQYEKIPNTPTAVPGLGDIIVWNTAVGQYGHVAIAKGEGNTTWFDSFDQNWPVGSKCHFQRHNYNGVIGWLRPKALIRPPIMPQVDPRDTRILELEQSLNSCLARPAEVKTIEIQVPFEVPAKITDKQKQELIDAFILANPPVYKELTQEDKKRIAVDYIRGLLSTILEAIKKKG